MKRSLMAALLCVALANVPANAQSGDDSHTGANNISVKPTTDGFATGIFIPGGGGSDGGDETRKKAASCVGCSYVRVPSCDINGFLGYDPVTGVALWENGVLCPRFTQSCPNGGNRWDIYLRRPGESAYHRIGSVCLLPGQDVMTGAQVAAAVRERFEDAVPASRFGFKPAPRQLVNEPTTFYVNEPSPAFPAHTVAGITVQITPKVEYYWRYETDGEFEGPTDAGAPPPDGTNTYVYRTPGRRQVTLRAVWTATFTVFGETFDVPGEVVRDATQTLDVLEAGADLYDD